MPDEVVITGYTTQQRKSVSGAITTVSFGEVNTSQADRDFAKLLQGKAPGVQITSASGSPGGGGNLLSGPLADINPSDIESITILKDANALSLHSQNKELNL